MDTRYLHEMHDRGILLEFQGHLGIAIAHLLPQCKVSALSFVILLGCFCFCFKSLLMGVFFWGGMMSELHPPPPSHTYTPRHFSQIMIHYSYNTGIEENCFFTQSSVIYMRVIEGRGLAKYRWPNHNSLCPWCHVQREQRLCCLNLWTIEVKACMTRGWF